MDDQQPHASEPIIDILKFL